jgi:hypothetical protein
MSFWDEENRVERMQDLWLSGMPAKKIAAEIGAATKNQVLGKAHRMGLSGRGPKQSTAGIPKKRIRIDRGGAGFRPLKSPPRPPRTPAEITDDNARILGLKPTIFGIENLEPHHCKYVHGEPSEQARCGRKRVDGLPYCQDHQTLCTAPPVPRQQRYMNLVGSTAGRLGHDVQVLKNVSELLDA